MCVSIITKHILCKLQYDYERKATADKKGMCEFVPPVGSGSPPHICAFIVVHIKHSLLVVFGFQVAHN